MINRFASLIIASLLVCPMAIAQSSRPDSASKIESSKADSGQKGILAGPDVDPNSEDITQMRFDGSVAGRGGRGQIVVPAKRWFAVLRSIELTEAQEIEIRPIVQSLQKATKKHDQEHGKRINQLREQVKQARRKNRDVPKQVRKELKNLRDRGPDIKIFQMQVWDLLSADQQEQMRKSLAKIRHEMAIKRKSTNTDKPPVMKKSEKDKKADQMDESSTRRSNLLKSHQTTESKDDKGG